MKPCYSFFLIFSSLSVFLSSCGKELKPYGTLEELRILAAIADDPELNPSATTHIRLLISDRDGAGRELTLQLLECSDPGISRGAEPNCDHDDQAQSLFNGSLNALSQESGYTGFTDPIAYTAPGNALDSIGTDALKQIGLNRLIVGTLTSSDGANQFFYKRIRVSLSPSPNQNPTLQGIEWNHETITFPSENLIDTTNQNASLRITPNASDEEVYSSPTVSGDVETKSESLLLSYFSTAGKWESTRLSGLADNPYESSALKDSTPNILVVVARDGRGGETARILRLR